MNWCCMVFAIVLLPACQSDGFDKPTDVGFLSDGAPLVSDGYGNSRVARYNAERMIDLEWGNAGCEHGEFDTPHGISVDEQDRVYVADRSNARIQVFDREGALLSVWNSELVGRPWGVEARGGIVYVVDGGDQDPDAPYGRVVLMSPDGVRLGTFGSAGSAPGQFLDGHDIAVDSTGAVYVAELIGRRIQKFVPTTP